MKYERMIRLLLSVVLVCALLTGCVSAASADSAAELSDALQKVCDLGIADARVLARADEVCTKYEAAKMLGNVHKLQYGTASKYLADQIVAERGSTATRYFFAQAIYFSAMETFYDVPFRNYDQWATYCSENEAQNIWPDSQVIAQRLDGTVGEGGVWDICPDLSEIEDPADQTGMRFWVDFGSSPAVNYAMLTYDRTNGKKVLELDENNCFRPFEPMTIAQVAEAALRYYNSFEPAAEMVSYADTAAFDSSIITPELLARETTLPDATCAQLPSEWHGTLMFDIGRVNHQTLDGMPDKRMYEYEIQTVKDAGFNFIGLAFDFSILQGPVPEESKLNEMRLREMDQLIAWCMERDIHVDLRCSGSGGLTIEDSFGDWQKWNHDSVNSTAYAPEFAVLWKAIAQRYADIPNCYLSFNLMIEPEISSDSQYAAFFGPVVEAIREVSPDRCIIADIHSSGLTGKTMAQMGVALSYHAYDPRSFCAVDYEMQDKPERLYSITWPYAASNKKTYDAQAVLDSAIPQSVSANELAALAKQYNVGFMVGEFGVFTTGMPYNRYSDETLSAYFRDMVSAMAEKGYGWCTGVWYGSYGVVCGCPAIKGAEYEQVGDYAFYIDKAMFDLFREINGVK
ncbi:MAG: cellulase family glycosylhydrolase [Clostridia bacterium]|nr:cellulase family glycosylhydrolase [Clostridia bacterium]